jgi:hypothetical protein
MLASTKNCSRDVLVSRNSSQMALDNCTFTKREHFFHIDLFSFGTVRITSILWCLRKKSFPFCCWSSYVADNNVIIIESHNYGRTEMCSVYCCADSRKDRQVFL